MLPYMRHMVPEDPLVIALLFVAGLILTAFAVILQVDYSEVDESERSDCACYNDVEIPDSTET